MPSPPRRGGARACAAVATVLGVSSVMAAAHALERAHAPAPAVSVAPGASRQALHGVRGASSALTGTTTMPSTTTSSAAVPTSSSTTAPADTQFPHAHVTGVFGDALADLVDPGLVDIVVTTAQQTTVLGTGMVLTPTGEVVTNDHVVAGAVQITVTDVGDGQRYDAQVVGADPGADVAVVQLAGAGALPTVALGRSSGLVPGQPVVAFGNANGVGGVPAEQPGTVSLLGAVVNAVDDITGSTELLSGLLQTSVPVVAGDSGGALVDSSGKVVGMVTAYASSGRNPEGFAIPVEQVMATVHRLTS